jgi:hypothetical protein
MAQGLIGLNMILLSTIYNFFPGSSLGRKKSKSMTRSERSDLKLSMLRD